MENKGDPSTHNKSYLENLIGIIYKKAILLTVRFIYIDM